jgi:hypothetical protein
MWGGSKIWFWHCATNWKKLPRSICNVGSLKTFLTFLIFGKWLILLQIRKRSLGKKGFLLISQRFFSKRKLQITTFFVKSDYFKKVEISRFFKNHVFKIHKDDWKIIFWITLSNVPIVVFFLWHQTPKFVGAPEA